MMDSSMNFGNITEHFAEMQARAAEIEARLAALSPRRESPSSRVGGASPTPDTRHPTPFSSLLANIGGNLQLRPLGSGAGPFAPEIEQMAAKYAAQNGLDPELVRGVIQQESHGDPKAESAVGAQGLMQLMPSTAAGFGATNPFDPEQNVRAGTRYLASLMREFNGDMDKTLAAYNAGPAAVKKAGGIPPFPETQNYVRRIRAMMGK